jgi:hypothetical protein
VRHPRLFLVVVELEHGANRIRRDPAVVLNQPFDPLLPVRKNILRTEPRPLDDGLAAPLSGHGLDQGAFGPINVFHDRSLTLSRPVVPAATQLSSVALKVDSPGILHKTAAGVVRLNLGEVGANVCVSRFSLL